MNLIRRKTVRFSLLIIAFVQPRALMATVRQTWDTLHVAWRVLK